MSNKHFELSSETIGTKRFRYEWCVEYEVKSRQSIHGHESVWITTTLECPNRDTARRIIYGFNKQPRFYRNAKIKRRLVEVNWEEYQDSAWLRAKAKRLLGFGVLGTKAGKHRA